MSKNICITLILLLGLFFGCEKNSLNPNGEFFTVEGKVLNSSGAVENATVKIDDALNWTTKTSSDGSFTIKNVTKGSHELSIKQQSDNGQFSIRNENIEVNKDLLLEALLLPKPVHLEEAVIDQKLTINKINLVWTRSTANDFREYKIYKHTTSGLDETTGELIHVSTTKFDTSFVDSLSHSSRYFYRVFVLNEYGQIGGSNIIEVKTGEFENNPELILSELKIGYLNKNEELWFFFQAEKGEFYKIAWYDGDWFDSYTASCIEVACYYNDQETKYFSCDRLIQMNGAPKIIMADATGNVYLKITGYGTAIYGTSDIEGTFGIKVDILDKNEATAVEVGVKQTVSINAGEMILLYFNSVADSNYVISLQTSSHGAAYDDQIRVLVSSYRENVNFTYFYDEIAGMIGFPSEDLEITAVATEKIYLIATGAYWWDPTTLKINIRKN